MQIPLQIYQLVEHNIRKWEISRKLKDSSFAKKKPIITISREAGGMGFDIAKDIANEFHFQVYDKEIIEFISKHLHRTLDELENLDEQVRSSFSDWMNALFSHDELSGYSYIQALKTFIKKVSTSGSVIILGRGANFFFSETEALHIRLVAPLAYRVEHLRELFKMSEHEAEKNIKDIDRAKHDFIKEYFDANIEDPHLYDLVINVTMGKEKVTQIIKNALNVKFM